MKCFIEFQRGRDRDDRERWVWEGAEPELLERVDDYVLGTGMSVRQMWHMPDDFPFVGLLNQKQYDAARSRMNAEFRKKVLTKLDLN